jgi:hypothetical protein
MKSICVDHDSVYQWCNLLYEEDIRYNIFNTIFISLYVIFKYCIVGGDLLSIILSEDCKLIIIIIIMVSLNFTHIPRSGHIFYMA